MANLLALDQSSHTTGYSIFEQGVLVKASHFDCSSSDFGKRLVQLKETVLKLIEEYKIDEVVFEDIQLQDVGGSKEAGIKTFKILAQTQGMLIELFTELKIKYTIVLPIKWKAHIGIAGKGRKEEKKMAQNFVLKNYKASCTEDEADSVCIGIYHLSTSNPFDWS